MNTIQFRSPSRRVAVAAAVAIALVLPAGCADPSSRAESPQPDSLAAVRELRENHPEEYKEEFLKAVGRLGRALGNSADPCHPRSDANPILVTEACGIGDLDGQVEILSWDERAAKPEYAQLSKLIWSGDVDAFVVGEVQYLEFRYEQRDIYTVMTVKVENALTGSVPEQIMVRELGGYMLSSQTDFDFGELQARLDPNEPFVLDRRSYHADHPLPGDRVFLALSRAVVGADILVPTFDVVGGSTGRFTYGRDGVFHRAGFGALTGWEPTISHERLVWAATEARVREAAIAFDEANPPLSSR
ncbi:MAG: hypothetical protein FWD59_04275 [Micrococcales bacterium]|nr:hypothetical protein [Micrococcales bacterium]